MIPILYEKNETAFSSNGLGRLADALSCVVTEEINGVYELAMQYPISGVHYVDIVESRIILAVPFDGGQAQPFMIYKISRPINGIVTINAQHISYILSGVVVTPFTATTPQQALSLLKQKSVGDNPFNFTSDVTSSGSMTVENPTAARSVLAGQSGSILDTWKTGEYEFNRFDVAFRSRRGSDNGVTLRYGKNITDLTSALDMTNVYTGIVPYSGNGEERIMLPEVAVYSSHAGDYPYKILKPVDFTNDFTEAPPTVEQLRAAAQSYVTSNAGWKLKNTIKVSFVALWDTEEYKSVAALQRVQMGDSVSVIYDALGVNFTTRVVKTEYDVLLERYDRITLGENNFTLRGAISEQTTAVEQSVTSHMQRAIERATKLIQGGLGGHVVMMTNANGEPEEILIMDTDDIATARNVIRMNLAGIGFSQNGYNGTYRTAWTIDGHFVADFIDSGTLDADKVNVIHLDASSIASGTIDASQITVKNIDASKITTGTLDAKVVNVVDLNADNITLGYLSASRIRGGELVLGRMGDVMRGTMKVYTTWSNTNPITIDQNGIFAPGSSTATLINQSGLAIKAGNTTTATNAITLGVGAVGSNPTITVGTSASSSSGMTTIASGAISCKSISAETMTLNSSRNDELTIGSSTLDRTVIKDGTINAKSLTFSESVTSVKGTFQASVASNEALSVARGYATIPDLRGAIRATSSGIYFFPGALSSPVSKKTVAKVATSATLAQAITGINNLIDALQDYNLIG